MAFMSAMKSVEFVGWDLKSLILRRILLGAGVYGIALGVSAAMADKNPRIMLWANNLKKNYSDETLFEAYKAGVHGLEVDSFTLGSAGISAGTNGLSYSGLDAYLNFYARLGAKSMVVVKPQSEVLWTKYPPLDETGSVGKKHKDLVGIFDIFHPEVRKDFFDWTTAVVDHYNTNTSVYGYWLFGAIGNTEWAYPFVVGTAPMVYSPAAKSSFREYLKQKYSNDLAALNRNWGTELSSWDMTNPPMKLKKGLLDKRPEWVDFVGWYYDSFMDFTEETFERVDQATDKPFGILFGGAPIGYGPLQSMSLMGPLVKEMAERGGMFCKGSAANYYLGLYNASARRFYSGRANYVDVYGENPRWGESPEAIGSADEKLKYGQTASEAMVRYFMDMLSFGFDATHYNSIEVMFDADGQPTSAYRMFKDGADLFRMVSPPGKAKRIGMLHSYVTSFFRVPYQNGDARDVYDTGMNLWPRKSEFHWARFLGQPDVVDDIMLEDGVLSGLDVLVVPNSSISMTTDPAYLNLCTWVKQGGLLVTFGPKNLKYLYHRDAHELEEVRYPLVGMLPSKVRWVKSGDKTYQVSEGYQKEIDRGLQSGMLTQELVLDPETLPAGSEILAVNGQGGVLAAVIPAAKGSGKLMVFSTPVQYQGKEVRFYSEVAPRLMRAYLNRQNFKYDVDTDRPEVAVAQSAGIDRFSGKELFTLTVIDPGATGKLAVTFQSAEEKLLAVNHTDVYEHQIKMSGAELIRDGYIQLWNIPEGLTSVEVSY